MKIIRRLIAVMIPLIVMMARVIANDSSYFASGNHLRPLMETEISIKKEVLTMRRIAGDKMSITVDYVFHNPAKVEKTLLMGFEASSPAGDVDGRPKNTGHPYIDQFRVLMNENPLSHKVAIYDLEEEKSPPQFTPELLANQTKIPEVTNENYTNLHYVYHFSAVFKPGDNSVKHTYEYAISSAVYIEAEMDYLLTPATRWASGKIDDFTLILDMGNEQEYHVAPAFFDSADDWQCEGNVKCAMEDVVHALDRSTAHMLTVWQRDGTIRFHAKDFKPKGEFSLLINQLIFEDTIINVEKIRLPFRKLPILHECALRNELSRKVLRNLPFAQRGYVFKDQELKDYFERQPWYLPNEKQADVVLSKEESEWRKKIDGMPIVKASESSK
jgi:hypothetical protein